MAGSNCGAVGIQQLRRALPGWLENAENGLSDGFRILFNALADDLRHLDVRITVFDDRITEGVKQDPVAKRLMTLHGVGPLTASALAGALGDVKAFRRGRNFDASLGLTPDRTALVDGIACWVSASAATATCASCSFTEPGPCCVMLMAKTTD